MFPVVVLEKYNGSGELDVTIDFLMQPLIENEIEYNFKLIWDGKSDSMLDICISVNDSKFDRQLLIENLEKEKMIEGLELYKEEYGEMKRVY